MVNNIRSLCARNENPPDPEPVRTSVKRVRANFLNSRKISLTCQSIRNSVHESPQAKHLLDPTRKSGRLRSPSPSPIPSPVSSPIPSPSRSSRFHVSRVVESNVVSSPITCTPPTCSPSSTTSSSRFRVTVVEPPKVMSAPVTIINNSTNKECDKSVQKKSESESIPVQMSVLQRTQSAPSSTMSAQSKEQPTIDAPTIGSISSLHTKTGGTKFTVSKPTDTEHIATTLTVIETSGNSFDSPDLEVKGYMDDSCSSFSSLDSIDRGQDFNTSLSSMESFDILGKNLHKPKQNVVTKNLSNSSIETESETVDTNKMENNPSSLEASTCSNDSIYGSQEFPALKISSNEGTLTNSPVSPCSGDIVANEKDSLSPKPDDKQQRVRKTSWISRGDAVDKLLSIFHHPGNLFFTRSNTGNESQTRKESQQQQQPQQAQTQTQTQESKPPSRKESPSGLFAWTKKENVFDEITDNKPSGIDTVAGVGQKPTKSPLQSNISPENTLTADSVPIEASIEAIPIQLKQDVKENTSPEHTVTVDSMTNLQLKTMATQTINSLDNSPKNENPQTDVDQQQATKNEKVHFEVGGDDDDDEYDDNNKNEYAGIQVNVNVTEGTQHHQPSVLPTANHISKAFGLGQITRDSLSILKGSSNNSQDSMRSLESLSEIVFEES